MALDPARARRFVDDHSRGVLLTSKRDGRPQASNISYASKDGIVRISVTADRAKAVNLRRDPRASLHVTSDDFWSYVVAEGDAELSAVAAQPGDATCVALRDLYETINRGPHPDWGEYDAAMVRDRRMVVTLRPTHLYGMVP